MVSSVQRCDKLLARRVAATQSRASRRANQLHRDVRRRPDDVGCRRRLWARWEPSPLPVGTTCISRSTSTLAGRDRLDLEVDLKLGRSGPPASPGRLQLCRSRPAGSRGRPETWPVGTARISRATSNSAGRDRPHLEVDLKLGRSGPPASRGRPETWPVGTARISRST